MNFCWSGSIAHLNGRLWAFVQAAKASELAHFVYIVPGLPYIGTRWDANSQARELVDMAKKHQFLGVTPIRWLEYLVAILAGNAIYYLSLAPHLPDALRHQGFQIDFGVFIDFVVCVAVYGLIRLGVRLNGGFLAKLRARE